MKTKLNRQLQVDGDFLVGGINVSCLLLACPHSMRSRVYETVWCLSVRPSVCPIRSLQQLAAGLLLWARQVGDIDRLMHGRRRSRTGRSATRGTICGQCHVYSRRRKLNTHVLN